MKRVLLVASNQEMRPYPVAPLGLCLLAEALKGRYSVRIFDGMFRDSGELCRQIAAFDPHYVGLGVRNVEDPVMERPRDYINATLKNFVRPIRETTNAPLIVGGAGYSLFPLELLRLFRAEYGVIGESELTFQRLLDTLDRKKDVTNEQIPGVVVSGAPAVPLSSPEVCVDLTELGPSRLDQWVDFSLYRPRGTYPIQTKRGCSQRCVYCTYPHIEGRRYRLRPAESIADELEEVQSRLGNDVCFEFVDSILNVPTGHAESICEELIRRGSKVHLRAMGLNPKGVTPELLSLMQRAGFDLMDCTLDSAAPAVLEGLGKGFTRESLESAALHIRQAGIPTIWFLLFGGPGETEQTFEQTMSFIDRFIDPRDMVYMWAGIRIYPRTRLLDIAIEQGMLSPGEDLLEPRFYVSPELGRKRCIELIEEACRQRPNCVPAWEAEPDKQMLRQAIELRKKVKVSEPMFRTLIRLRRQRMGVTARI